MRPVIVVGHAALDRIYRIDAFPSKPTKIRASQFVEVGGGMGANAAVTIAHLGGKVELWSRTGSDAAGGKIKDLLLEDGVGTSHVRALPGRSATSAIIVDAKGERLIVSDRDNSISTNCDWLPFETIARAGAVLSDLRWFEATAQAFEKARQCAVPTIIDADLGGGDQLAEFLKWTDVAIFSAPEFERFLPGMSDEDRLARLLEMGVRHAGVTRGAEGYFWRNREGGSKHQRAFKVDVLDTTGAGDAFHGAFAWAIARGLDDAQCARIAAGVAAMKCRRPGGRAGLPEWPELEAFLALEA